MNEVIGSFGRADALDSYTGMDLFYCDARGPGGHRA
jgi:hypothetical protein